MTTTTRAIDNLLAKLYYNPSEPAGYGGVDQLKLQASKTRNVHRSVVTEWLRKQTAYTRHKSARKHFPRNRTLTRGLDYIWQADLVDMQRLASKNARMKYLLTVVDTFSRFAFVRPVKDKSGPEIVRALSDIFRKSGRKPNKICTDMGKEFTNKNVQDFLREKNVFHYTVASDTKAAMVERFNRTLKERMWRYFTHTKTDHYLNVLDKFVESYNKRKHRIIGRPPIEVTKANEKQLWQKLYGGAEDGRKKGKEKKIKPELKVGDRVRLSKAKDPFEKGYRGYWTNEFFTVDQVRTNQKYPMYIVKDDRGEILKGAFYDRQLQKITTE